MTKRYFSDAEVNDIIATVTGTCMPLDDVCEQLYECDASGLTQVQHLYIDTDIFQCEICGWWFEMYEQGESDDLLICESCADA